MKFEAVLFDCDGVLVDSETITNTVLRDMLEEIGWSMTLAECMARFVGKAVRDERAQIEAHTGRAFSEAWLASFWQRRNEALEVSLSIVPGALAAVRELHAACAGRIACASGADRAKIVLQLRKVGLLEYFEARIFSGYEMPRSKPFPDVYLAAAAALGVDPARCAVIEDTATGAAAGVAAGATVYGFCPGGPSHSSASALRAAGVQRLFDDMACLPELLGCGPGAVAAARQRPLY